MLESYNLGAMLFGGAVKTVYFAGAYLAVRAMLRMMDRVTGVQFKEWMLNADKDALATYFGCRFIAVCILAGLIFM